MTINYGALKTELNTDPAGLGYAPFLAKGDDVDLANLLNFVRDGTTACPVNNVIGAAITVRRADIDVASVYAAIAVSDYTSLPTNPNSTQLSTERRLLAWLTGLAAMATIRLLNDDGTDTPVIANFKAMFAAGTATLTRLNTLSTRNGSRAEQLFGEGTTLSPLDVGTAVNLP